MTGRGLHLGLFGHLKGVVNLNAKVANGTFELRVQNGWNRELVGQYRAQGLRYSRPRNTFLGPVMTNEDLPEDDDEEDDNKHASGREPWGGN